MALLTVLFWLWLIGVFALAIAWLLMWRMRKYSHKLIVVPTHASFDKEIGDVILVSGAPARVVEVHVDHLLVELM